MIAQVQVIFQNQDGQPLTLSNEWELYECADATSMNCNPATIGDGGAGAFLDADHGGGQTS